MKTEIINIGNELLIGQVVNTNASWMAEKLNLAGFAVHKVTVIADKEADILESLREAGERSDVILVTGGLGPTKDDITKKAVCEFFHTRLIFSEEAYKGVERLFHARGIEVTPINRAQAEIPEGCTPLPNNNGTAPGMWMEKITKSGRQVFVFMPGVPFEMKAMMEDSIIPLLKHACHPVTIYHKTILTQGIGESFLSDILQPWEDALPGNISLAYLPQPGIVRLRLTGTGEDEIAVKAQVEAESEKLSGLISKYIFGYDDETLELIIGRLLREKRMTLSTAESCTGGYIAHLVTSVAGSSDYFKGSVVAYDNRVKTDLLDVPEEILQKHGAVSEDVVKIMAGSVRQKF